VSWGSSAPIEGVAVADAAINQALDLGHTPHVAAWHRISKRMWATTCESCGAEVWLTGPAGGWRCGGSAVREICPGDVPPNLFPGGAA
jgi:hypothetical protein